LVLGAVTTLTLSACGSDEGTGTKGTGGSSTTSTGGSATTGTGGTSTGGSTGTAQGGTPGTATGGTTSTAGSKSTGGSTAATGGSTATGNNCQSACTKLKAANCGDLSQTDCSTACTGGTACVSESDAYYGCVAATGTVSCDTEAMSAQVAGCDTSARALDICATCLAGDPATESTCSTCSKASCCTQRKAYLSSSDVDGFYTCASAATCNTQACYDGCVAMYPNAAKNYDALDACESKSCVSTCLCGANTNDTACLACVKTSCCDDFGALVNSSDYAVFNKCLNGCANADQACFDGCVTASPVAGAAYDQLGANCLSTTCSAECTGP
jgi:hypothetical protein